jgi:hypothetical protein
MVRAPPDAVVAFNQIADEHEAIANVLVMASCNADVGQLNALAGRPLAPTGCWRR